jgi:hypothetical protein
VQEEPGIAGNERRDPPGEDEVDRWDDEGHDCEDQEAHVDTSAVVVEKAQAPAENESDQDET